MISLFPLLWLLHSIAALATIVGIVLLLAWAIRHWPVAQLKFWGIWLFAGGLVVCVLTFAASGFHGGGMQYDGNDSYVKNRMMLQNPMHRMMDGSMMRDIDMMDEDMDPMSMSMGDMGMMLEGKTGDAFDKAFIEGMIPHHQGAIDMAEMALESAKHEEVKNMARNIMSTQQSEINQMKQWMTSWGYDAE